MTVIARVVEAARSGGDVSLGEAETMLGQMKMIFDGQLPFRERTAVVKLQQPRVQAAFAQMATAIAALKRGDRKAADDLERGWASLTAALEALREEEAAWPTWSRSPYMNVLMRLATGVSRGTIAPEALRQGLSEMLTMHRRFAASVRGMARPGRDAARFAERRKEIEGAMATIEAALVEAHGALVAGRSAAVLKALERGCKAADALAAIQDDFQQADEAARFRPCFRCGAQNVRSQRHCAKCGGMLPPMPVGDDEDGSLDVVIEEGGMRSRGHVQSELTHRLQEAVAGVVDGRLPRDRFARVLDEAEQRLIKARRDFEALPMDPEAAPDVAEAMRQMADRMRTGFDEFNEGLDVLRRFLVDGNRAHLDHGLEAALSGADKIASLAPR